MKSIPVFIVHSYGAVGSIGRVMAVPSLTKPRIKDGKIATVCNRLGDSYNFKLLEHTKIEVKEYSYQLRRNFTYEQIKRSARELA